MHSDLTESSPLTPEDKLYYYHDVRRALRESSDSSLATPTRRNAGHHQPNGVSYSTSSSTGRQQPESKGRNSFHGSKKLKLNGVITIFVSVLALGLCLSALFFDAATAWWRRMRSNASSRRTNAFDDAGRYVTENYDTRSPFSDFLPGLAGIYGKPLYAFVVNRGQAIAAFGIESKDYPILEFQSANKAYQTTPLLGFRTFLQGSRRSGDFLSEPFSPLTTNFPGTPVVTPETGSLLAKLPKRTMFIGENELQLQEIDYQNQIETNVTYFILPEEDFGAFVRRTTFTNMHSREPVTLSILDGLARMEPAGGRLDKYLKNLGQTVEGFMGVYFPYTDSITMPFYRLTIQPSDSTRIHVQDRGHYCLSFLEGSESSGIPPQLLPIVYDTNKIFGEDTSLLRPIELLSKTIKDIVNGPQYGQAKTSSCFGAGKYIVRRIIRASRFELLNSRLIHATTLHFVTVVESISLEPGDTITISTFFGAANGLLEVPVIARRIMQEGFVMYKLTRTREVIRQITKSVATRTSHHLFDAHIQQTYLDNSLRGGIPIILGDQDDGMSNADEDPRLKVFHVFSRIHGDLERDDNDFMLSPTFFSQVRLPSRQVAQNRRMHIFWCLTVLNVQIRS